MADLSVYGRQKTLADYMGANRDRALAEQLQAAQIEQAHAKALSDAQGGSLPATLQVANEVQKAIKAGDFERANLIMQTHKTFDKGILPYGSPIPQGNGLPPIMPQNTGLADVLGQNAPPQLPQEQQRQALPPVFTGGGVGEIPGYGALLANREAQKAGAAERAKLGVQQELQPEIERRKAEQTVLGKSSGEAAALLNEMVAGQPKLDATVKKLSELGKKATFTFAGQALDFARTQTGFSPRDSAIARREYIATVDNEVLPLLRQTFGAAFTQREGEDLKATLGDANVTPEEKDAVLRAFINNKITQIEMLKRQTGQAPAAAPTPGGSVSYEEYFR